MRPLSSSPAIPVGTLETSVTVFTGTGFVMTNRSGVVRDQLQVVELCRAGQMPPLSLQTSAPPYVSLTTIEWPTDRTFVDCVSLKSTP